MPDILIRRFLHIAALAGAQIGQSATTSTTPTPYTARRAVFPRSNTTSKAMGSTTSAAISAGATISTSTGESSSTTNSAGTATA